MSSPVEKLRLGIIGKDWQLVEQAYAGLTGEKPKKKVGRPKKTEVVENLFTPELAASLETEFVEESKRIKRGTPRTRPETRFVEMTCGCGKKEMVNAAVARITVDGKESVTWKCNQCCTKRR